MQSQAFARLTNLRCMQLSRARPLFKEAVILETKQRTILAVLEQSFQNYRSWIICL